MKMIRKKVLMKQMAIVLGMIAVVFFLQIASNFASAAAPLQSPSPNGIITCGKPGQTEKDPATGATVPAMCHLCDLIAGINTVIQYMMWISIAVALAVFTAAGIMYIMSSGGSSMIEMAKTAMKNAAIGFVVIFSAYLIIDGVVLRALGTAPGLGVGNVTWGNFQCNANLGGGTATPAATTTK